VTVLIDRPTAPLRIKLLFWAILASFSLLFSEVFAGSDMFPFFHFWGLAAELPLYGLHVAVLAFIVFRLGKPAWPCLFLAGAIVGMYEAYLTKVLWDPPWGDAMVVVGGVGIIETIVLVLFWHPFLAFILPLTASSLVLGNGSALRAGMPVWLRNHMGSEKAMNGWAIMIAVIFGVFQSTNAPDPLHSLLSGPSAVVVLAVEIRLFRTITRHRYQTLRSLLPDTRQFFALFTLLLFLYVFMGKLVRPEALPSVQDQATVWGLYGMLFLGLFLCLKQSNKTMIPDGGLDSVTPSRIAIGGAVCIFTACSVAGRLYFFHFRGVILLSCWLIFSFIGIIALFLSLKYAALGWKVRNR